MISKNSPISQALMRIEDAFRVAGLNVYGKAIQALAWIALARLDAAGKLALSLDEIVQRNQWNAARDAGLKQEAVDLLHFGALDMSKRHGGQKLEVLEATSRLSRELKDAAQSAWDVLPYFASSERGQFNRPEVLIDQQVVELMVDMLAEPTGSVWTPFDMSGQIAITAARRGYEVNTASIFATDDLLSHLLLCIETAGGAHERIKNIVHRDPAGRPMTREDFVIAAPPFNMSTKTAMWAQWEDEESDRYETYDRSDAWAVANLLKRTNHQLVILTSQSWLFATGQERRLRETLLAKNKNFIETVTTLPGGALAATTIASAITTFNKKTPINHVHMTSHIVDSKAIPLDDFLKENSDIIREKKGESTHSRSVSIDEINQADFVLLPQRLFRKAVLSGSNFIPLGQICTAVRPTSNIRGNDGDFVTEIGTAALRDRKWRPVRVSDAEDYKSICVNSNQREESFLIEDDLVLSVKGTLGLIRLVSESFGIDFDESIMYKRTKAVVSTSCLGLRLNRESITKGVTPKYLLMYMRSAEGQEQIRSLQVGAAMPHITVADLLSSVRIPIPSEDELERVESDFEKLCSYEEDIEQIELEMEEVAESRWTVKLA